MTPPTLHPGSHGADVRRLQRIFVMTKELDFEQIDGVFGPRTEAAVRSFRRTLVPAAPYTTGLPLVA